MASIAHSRDVLKRQWFCRSEFLMQYLRADKVIAAAQAASYSWRQRIWPPMLTLWAFLVQVLHPGWSCRAAVAHVLAEHAAAGKTLDASADPSAYCQARKRVPLSVYSQALRTVGETLQSQVGDTHLWCGRRVWVVDGSSCSMPDTPELQETFGQPDRQKEGCGFPVAKLVAMFCWASGAVLDVTVGPYRSNELSLWRRLWDQFKAGDVALGDRWTMELRIREIKTTLRMDVLRNKSPDAVHKEIRMHLLAYNLIRALMWQAAREHGRSLHRLSFAGTMQRFEAIAPYLCLLGRTSQGVMMYRLLLSWIALDLVPHRPHRIEPRALKRRLKPYDLLNRPREQMREQLLR